MAAYLDKQKINTAITENTKLDLSHQHISSGDFFQTNVSYLHEMVPGEKINFKMETFARLNPLVVPTFGRANMRHRYFYVPFRTIFHGWNDFITDAVHIPSDYSTIFSTNSVMLDKCPTMTLGNLQQAFTDVNYVANASSTVDTHYFSWKLTNQNLTVYDFMYAGEKYNYTLAGRQAVKVLESLGYKIVWDSKFSDVEVNAMPLLAYGKVYTDWFYPSQYRNTATYDYIQAMCNQDVNSGAISLNFVDIHTILEVCMFAQYDSSYLTSAWDQPNEPSIGNYSNFKIVNLDTVSSMYLNNGGTNVSMDFQDAGFVTNNTGNANTTDYSIGGANAPFINPVVKGNITNSGVRTLPTPISEYLLHSLHAMTDYMKRHQLAGSRAMDRYLARFGKALSAEKLNRSMYLGSDLQNIQIGDIMSTADTINGQTGEGAQLGSFAGKGISYGSGGFTFDTDEFGYIIVISTIIPDTDYFQGFDRQVFRTRKLDFWTPEYDSLGVQPITAAEVLIPNVLQGLMQGDPFEQVFGYTPRYADYKVAHDQLTGNFRVPSINGGSEELPGSTNTAGSWHLMRVLKPIDFNLDYANVVHSPDFVSGKSDFSQYKRLFYNDNAFSPDNFTIIHNFDIASYAPMKALYDTYEFEDKGKKITLETNGVKLN